jgi:hypothetical protein
MEFTSHLPDGWQIHYKCKNQHDFSNMLMFIISNSLVLPNISIYGDASDALATQKIVKQHLKMYLSVRKTINWDNWDHKNVEVTKIPPNMPQLN